MTSLMAVFVSRRRKSLSQVAEGRELATGTGSAGLLVGESPCGTEDTPLTAAPQCRRHFHWE